MFQMQLLIVLLQWFCWRHWNAQRMEHGLTGVMDRQWDSDNFKFIKKRCAILVYMKGNAHVYMKGNAQSLETSFKKSTKPFHPLKAKPFHRNFYNRNQIVKIKHSFICRSHGHCMRITKNWEQSLPLVILCNECKKILGTFKQRLFLNMGQQQVCSFQTWSIISQLHL